MVSHSLTRVKPPSCSLSLVFVIVVIPVSGYLDTCPRTTTFGSYKKGETHTTRANCRRGQPRYACAQIATTTAIWALRRQESTSPARTTTTGHPVTTLAAFFEHVGHKGAYPGLRDLAVSSVPPVPVFVSKHTEVGAQKDDERPDY